MNLTIRGANNLVPVSFKQRIRYLIHPINRKFFLLGLTLSFLKPLDMSRAFGVPKEEEEEIDKLIKNHQKNIFFELINFNHIAPKDKEIIFLIISDYLNINKQIGSGGDSNVALYERNINNSTLQMYFAVRDLFTKIPDYALNQIKMIIRNGVHQWGEENKKYSSLEFKKYTVGKAWKLSRRILSSEKALAVSTGIMLSYLLSERLGRTSFFGFI